MADDFFKYESVLDLRLMAEHLRALTEGFETGNLKFTHGDQEIVFHPQGLVGLTVDAKAKGERRKLTIKLGWKEKGEGDGTEEPLLISAEPSNEPSR